MEEEASFSGDLADQNEKHKKIRRSLRFVTTNARFSLLPCITGAARPDMLAWSFGPQPEKTELQLAIVRGGPVR